MKLKNSAFDIAINIVCLLQLLGIVLYLLIVWSSLPDRIPGHFGADGAVTRYDGRGVLLVGPIFAGILFGGIVLLERFPQVWNAGVTVTEENKAKVYRTVKSLLAATKLILVTAFIFIAIIQSLGRNLPGWFLPVFIWLLAFMILFFIIRLIYHGLKARM
ncbi:MAG: DUF1648 domain-containing protein [Oscillospiraceae bacterium]|nr:DUF1648 domain-containing protein [Oscillospiraceae bacterium]